jgi:ABC-type methionine transport system permease subunit
MRYFELLNFQHVMGYIFVSLLFMLVFAIGLGFMHFRSERAERRKSETLYRFADEITDRDAPFPLVMIVIIAGTVSWGFLYILVHGIWGVKI